MSMMNGTILNLSMGGARMRPGRRPPISDILSQLRSLQRPGRLLQVFDSRGVAGRKHVLSAFLHARRAAALGRLRLKDEGAVMSLYMAGTDQLEKALARVGIVDDTEDMVIVQAPSGGLGEACEAMGLLPADDAFPEVPTLTTLKRIGIETERLSGLPVLEWELSVLEHVALVDMPR